jgi:outer membrane protein assembly factor BamB
LTFMLLKKPSFNLLIDLPQTLRIIHHNLSFELINSSRKEGEEKMSISTNKTTAFAFAIFLVLTIAAPMITAISAQTTKKNSYGFISTSPRVVQINTALLVNGWTSPTPPEGIMGAGVNVFYRFNYTVTLTKPSGATVIKTGINAYADATFYYTYTPDELGNWTAVLYWPGDANFLACTSPPFTFTVQQDPIPKWPDAALPTEYWTRPVNAENRDWSQYLADWNVDGYPEDSGKLQPYGHAPVTSHILWTRELAIGGIMTDEWGGAAYRATVIPTAIIGGRAYYSMRDGYHCLDIYTGEEVWDTPRTIPGSLFFITMPADPDPGGAATHSEIWSYRGVGWIEVYDANTGLFMSNKTGAAWANAGISKLHEGYFYFLNGRNWTKWSPYDIGPSGIAANRSIMQATYPDKVVWSVNITAGVTTPSIYTGNYATNTNAMSAFDLKTGNLLWNVTTRPEAVYFRSGHCQGQGYYFATTMTMTWRAYDLSTGLQAWESPPAQYPWGTFWSYNSANAYGKLYGMGYDGHVYAYDIKTGHIVWSIYAGDAGAESPWGTWSFWGAPVVADGKIYVGTTEHTPTQPRIRGNRLYCIDDSTGKVLWTIAGAYASTEIADSMLIAANEYDSLMYCFGKGPTATTVSVSPTVIGNGSSALIQGTVLDQSPGQKDTACVSKDSMSGWMEYLHMQKPMPTNTTGVPVQLRAMSSDGSITELGTVTSDLKGHFEYLWTPPTQDTYKIMASFNGDDSYWGSWEETGLGVTLVQSTTSEAQGVQTDISTLLYGILAAVVVAIIIGIVAIFVALRKR